MHNAHKPCLLLILDGWGHREAVEHNAIAQAQTPCWDALWNTQPHTLLDASGHAVGLPDAQMGNSEVGHLSIGAGRCLPQGISRITEGLEQTNTLEQLPALANAFSTSPTLHLLGLLSPGGVHSHLNHTLSLIRLAHQAGVKELHLHAFLDGRDTPPQSAQASIEAVEALFAELNFGRIASLSGRYYAMDRDKRWDRVQKSYDLLVSGQADHQATTALDALAHAYERQETDEFVQPTLVGKAHPIQASDSILHTNFRADRARQLTEALTQENFSGFPRTQAPLKNYTCLMTYDETFNLPVIFPPLYPENNLGEMLSAAGKKQLRLAETEKYAHVTFFFNGGREAAFPGEDRKLIPSPKVATYDLAPAMNADKLTDALVEAISAQQHDFIVCNYANADMVGHTGNFEATKKAIETLDACLERITEALAKVEGEALITADHGNAEYMFDTDTEQAHTAHTTSLVPLVYVGSRALKFSQEGTLADLAPSLLSLMGLTVPDEMSGTILHTIGD